MAVGRVPVWGRYRPEILRALGAQVVSAWAARVRGSADAPLPLGAMAPLVASAAHSARLVAANRQGVRELAAAVARTHDPALVRFLVLVVPEWLLVERRLERAGRNAGRGGHCKLCRQGLGEVPVSETVRHLFVCRNPRMMERMSRLVVDGVKCSLRLG